MSGHLNVFKIKYMLSIIDNLLPCLEKMRNMLYNCTKQWEDCCHTLKRV